MLGMYQVKYRDCITGLPHLVYGWKGFNEDMTCRDFQFEIGGCVHVCYGRIEPCKNGLHFCRELGDCYDYYDPWCSVFCEVAAFGTVKRAHNDPRKFAASHLVVMRQVPWSDIGCFHIKHKMMLVSGTDGKLEIKEI